MNSPGSGPTPRIEYSCSCCCGCGAFAGGGWSFSLGRTDTNIIRIFSRAVTVPIEVLLTVIISKWCGPSVYLVGDPERPRIFFCLLAYSLCLRRYLYLFNVKSIQSITQHQRTPNQTTLITSISHLQVQNGEYKNGELSTFYVSNTQVSL